MKEKLYIAYGSNMNIRQMARRCPTAKVVGKMLLQGYELRFYGSENNAVATIEPFQGGVVPVTIWSITPEDEASLDRYEGYPHLYRKDYMIIPFNGKGTSAMVYLMNTESCSIGCPSRVYLETILEGYSSAGFSPDYIEKPLEKAILTYMRERR